ncbi:MAG TPA: hypothetical protein VFG19_10810 [Geobacteraceae bacterium]|nr:hypothetical protein [Geobacteraceae bacterium]
MSDKSLEWSNSFPGKPGYYWVRQAGRKFILDVQEINGDFYVLDHESSISVSYVLGSEWYGPLEPPE